MRPVTVPAGEIQTILILFLVSFLIFNIGFRYVGSGDTLPNELLPISILREGNFDFNEFFPKIHAFTIRFQT